MNNVVMIAYGFPPEGNAGSYRPLRFVRQLPNFGWNPIVVSAIPSHYERYDAALLTKVPKQIQVIRVPASDPWQSLQAYRSQNLSRESASHEKILSGLGTKPSLFVRDSIREIVRTAEAWWYHPDMAMPWIQPAIEATIEASKRINVSVIWATAGPVSSFVVAKRSSLETGIPYVLDFRDAWTITYNAFEARQPQWVKRRARRDMYEFLSGAKAVVFRYGAEAECFWRAYPGALDPSRMHIIPNGYESPIEEASFSASDKCTVLYAGTLPDYRYDTLLTALRIFKQTDPVRARALRLVFVGEGTNVVANEAEALDLTDIVQTAARKSYSEITSLQRQADALLILGRPSTMSGYELFAAAKLFGYFKTGRPIIGVLPQDETRKILNHLGVGTVADVDSVQDICRVLGIIIENWSRGTLSALVPDRKACEEYSSERQTATLVRALEGLPAEKEFKPGANAIPPSLRNVIGQWAV